MTLSGYTVTRNCIELDYCYELTIQSLLDFCDEVIVCDSDSTDGTLQVLTEWAKREPKLRIVNWPWPNPFGDWLLMVKWQNVARQCLSGQMQFYLEADEIVHEESYGILRKLSEAGGCHWIHRLNFIQDTRHLIPHGQVCGHLLARFGPAKLPMPDGPIPGQYYEIQERAGAFHQPNPLLRIFHYGFIRKNEAMYKKVKVLHPAILGTADTRTAEAERKGTSWLAEFQDCLSERHLLPYRGTHPKIAHGWLTERGYQL